MSHFCYTKAMQHNLDTYNEHVQQLPFDTQTAYHHYMLGALSDLVDPKIWKRAMSTADRCTKKHDAR